MLAASRVACWWAATYTLGLASSVRDMRRAEITSDTWEQQFDESDRGVSRVAIATSMFGRWLRGVPADLLWRVNVEGPKMDIRIPFQRIAGGLLLSMVLMMVVASSISGYDTRREGFEGEVVRLAALNGFENGMNAAVRAFVGFALIGVGAGLYAALQDRSRALSAVAAFGLAAAGVLTLVASMLQIVFVELAEQYVATTGAEQQSVLVSARSIALAVENTTGAGFFALVLSTFVLAILMGREALVPRWLIGVPVMGAGLIIAGFTAEASGFEGGAWGAYIAGLLMSVIWLLIAGIYLVLSGGEKKAAVPAVSAEGAA